MYLKETFGNFASIYYIGKISIPNKSNIRYTLMKNRLKAMESYLRLAALEFNNPVQDTAHYALALTLDYFETYDNLHNSDRHYIFCQLYFKSAYRNASEVKKSMHLSVSVATLCRYRKKFIEAFIYYCNLLEPSYFDDLNKTTGFSA